MKKKKRQEYGQNRAGFVNGNNLVDVSQLQGLKITEPGRPGCQAGQDQKQQCFSFYPADLLL